MVRAPARVVRASPVVALVMEAWSSGRKATRRSRAGRIAPRPRRVERPAYPAWTLIFGSPAAGAQLLAYDPAAAVDIPLRLAVIGRDGGSEIVLRDMRTLIDADVADGFTAVLRGLAEAARERV